MRERGTIENRALLVVLTLAVLGGLVACGDPPEPGDKQPPSPPAGYYQLECRNPGSHQDVAKTPIIKNTSGKTIPAGEKMSWSSSDGDYRQIDVQQNLAPDMEIQGLGSAGNSYSCAAHVWL